VILGPKGSVAARPLEQLSALTDLLLMLMTAPAYRDHLDLHKTLLY
jgi:hypothetical protein